MKKEEYLVTVINKETLENIDMFYIDATDMLNAKEIASDIMHDYDNVNYLELLAIVETGII